MICIHFLVSDYGDNGFAFSLLRINTELEKRYLQWKICRSKFISLNELHHKTEGTTQFTQHQFSTLVTDKETFNTLIACEGAESLLL